MAPIIWDRRLATGHDELDAQHRTLIDTFNRIEAAVGRPEGNRDELEGILTFLRDYAMLHFELEQELMVRHRYPLEAEHRLRHADLAGEMETILDGFRRGTKGVDPGILDYLDAWLQHHIREEDVPLADFLRNA